MFNMFSKVSFIYTYKTRESFVFHLAATLRYSE